MAIWTGRPHTKTILSNFDHFKHKCIFSDGSIFTEDTLWSSNNIDELKHLFVDNPIDGKRTFYQKLQEQLTPATPNVKKLAAEALWLLFIFTSEDSYKPKRKRKEIKTIWEFSGSPLPDSKRLSDDDLSGLANPGPYFLIESWAEFGFLLNVVGQLKSLSPTEVQRLLTDNPWGFSDWLTRIEDGHKRAFKHMLLYLAYPSYFERICSFGEKKKIVTVFFDRVSTEHRDFSLESNLDRALLDIRASLEAENGTSEVDFYREPLKTRWRGSDEDAFLITFKPSRENPEDGWPLEKMQALVGRFQAKKTVVENWRFRSRKKVKINDRIFLLVQGKMGPAIIGYGRCVGEPQNDNGTWRLPVQFENLVDPTKEVFADQSDLDSIADARKYWNTQSSGIFLREDVSLSLESLVVGKPAKQPLPPSSNPDWTRDELIVALDAYLTWRSSIPAKGSAKLSDLSKSIRLLGERLFRPEDRSSTFRNESGVYMKLMNFRRLDPHYTAQGKKGLSAGAKGEEDVWAEFADDPERCHAVAQAILSSLTTDDSPSYEDPSQDNGDEEGEEGRILTRKHLARERNKKLVDSKKNQAKKKYGRLICEACDFVFSDKYGDRGTDFIECHHTKPVHTLIEGHKTHINDLALVCSNCHRMIHRKKKWLTLDELREILAEQVSTATKRSTGGH